MHEINVSKEIEYVREALNLLIHMGSGKTFENISQIFEQNPGQDMNTFQKKKKIFSKIEKEMEKRLATKQEEMEYYFHSEEKEQRCVGPMVLLWNTDAYHLSELNQLESYMNSFEGSAYCECFSLLLTEYLSFLKVDDSSEEKKQSEGEVIRQIMEMEIEDQEKMKLQMIFLYPEEHRKKVMSLMEISMSVLKKYQNDLEWIGEEFSTYWKKTLKTVDLMDMMHHNLGVVLDENSYGVKLYPNMIMLRTVSVFAKGAGEVIDGPYEIHFGVMINEHTSLQKRKEDDGAYQQKILEQLKLLSDKSKFEILSLIKEKRAYGSELAKQLNLTPATISYHMSTLMSAGLVRVEKEDTRIYYASNPEAIDQLFSYCHRKLVDK